MMEQTMQSCDVVVIGAGPAGMAAASLAAEAGLSTILLDEQPLAGGQIYRAVEAAWHTRGDILGSDYLSGGGLVAGLVASGAKHLAGATVWSVHADGRVAWSRNGIGHQLQAQRIIIATGALERPVPLPGWTLPGVMTAGAAQILLKQSGIIPNRAVIAGCGPLIYLIAQQLVRAGSPPLAIVETQRLANFLQAMRHFPGALRGWRYLTKGAAMLREIRSAGIKRYTACSQLSVLGKDRVTGFAFKHRGNRVEIPCGIVLLHQGVVPNIQITRALGADHIWDDRQRCFHPKIDDWGRTNLPQIYVAGDGGGIAGAKAAALTGELAALDIARRLGRITDDECDQRETPLRRQLAAERAIRPFLDTLYPPSREILSPADATIICRCEEVTAGDIRRYAQLGCMGPNQTKAFGRCGMGPCQGRYCGLTVTELLAKATGLTQKEVGYYRIRTPLKPITLGELASIGEKDADAA
jgi:NADPH-dependent 2,4-dienoyl-CoA reductase/sulfur reductase-like enzyme